MFGYDTPLTVGFCYIATFCLRAFSGVLFAMAVA